MLRWAWVNIFWIYPNESFVFSTVWLNFKSVIVCRGLKDNTRVITSFLRTVWSGPGLTLSILGTNFSRRNFHFFSYFFQKIGFDISCKLVSKETICMKYQSLLSEKKLRKISSICRPLSLVKANVSLIKIIFLRPNLFITFKMNFCFKRHHIWGHYGTLRHTNTHDIQRGKRILGGSWKPRPACAFTSYGLGLLCSLTD